MVKKILPWVVFIALFGLIIIGLALRDNMNNYLSKMMKEQAVPEIKTSGTTYVDTTFNYTKIGLSYQLTFLEFGATSCSSCKRLEKVMEEVKNKYPQTVNVVFMNVLKPESKTLMKYYGVASIPMQVLLDKNGIEFFRHYGYISADDLMQDFKLSTSEK